MAGNPEALDPQLLLAQTDWVRDLARRLVRDSWRADDVAQETLLAAMTRPPRIDGSTTVKYILNNDLPIGCLPRETTPGLTQRSPLEAAVFLSTSTL